MQRSATSRALCKAPEPGRGGGTRGVGGGASKQNSPSFAYGGFGFFCTVLQIFFCCKQTGQKFALILFKQHVRDFLIHTHRQTDRQERED